jgi:hypothetical protein
LSSAEFELRLRGNKTSTLAEIPVTYNCPFCHRSLGSFELMNSLSLSLSLVTHIHTHTLSLYLLTLSCTHFLSLDLLALFCTRNYLSFLSLSLCRCVSLSLFVSLSLSRHRSTHTPTHILSLCGSTDLLGTQSTLPCLEHNKCECSHSQTLTGQPVV